MLVALTLSACTISASQSAKSLDAKQEAICLLYQAIQTKVGQLDAATSNQTLSEQEVVARYAKLFKSTQEFYDQTLDYAVASNNALVTLALHTPSDHRITKRCTEHAVARLALAKEQAMNESEKKNDVTPEKIVKIYSPYFVRHLWENTKGERELYTRAQNFALTQNKPEVATALKNDDEDAIEHRRAIALAAVSIPVFVISLFVKNTK